jgi:hypothetical protein
MTNKENFLKLVTGSDDCIIDEIRQRIKNRDKIKEKMMQELDVLMKKDTKITDDILLNNGFYLDDYIKMFIKEVQDDEFELKLINDENKYFVYVTQYDDYDGNDQVINIPAIQYAYQLENLIQLLENNFDFKLKI